MKSLLRRGALRIVFGLLCLAWVLGASSQPRPETHWVQVKDAYRVHERLLNREGNFLGEYYEIAPGEFTAVCYAGKLESFATQLRAREFVLGCEVWA